MSDLHPTAAPQARPALPRRALAVLLVLVAGLHWLALGGLPVTWAPPTAPAEVQPLQTRRIEAPPPAPPPSATPRPVRQPPANSAKRVQKPPVAPTPIQTPPEPPSPVLSTDTSPADVTDAAAGPPPANAPESVAPASAPAVAQAAPPPDNPANEPQPTPVHSMDLPGSVDLAYKVIGGSKGLTYYANAELAWRNSTTDYDASLVVSALFVGKRTMSSTGQLSPQGLAPTRFADRSRSEVAAHFEPGKGLVTFSANTPSVKWVPGAQDRVSVFMQLSGMLAGDAAAYPAGSTITVYTVGPRDADNWTFRVETPETLQLPFGELQGLKLSRVPRANQPGQKVEIWFAPSLLYLPVRIRITQSSGDFVDQQLTDIHRP